MCLRRCNRQPDCLVIVFRNTNAFRIGSDGVFSIRTGSFRYNALLTRSNADKGEPATLIGICAARSEAIVARLWIGSNTNPRSDHRLVILGAMALAGGALIIGGAVYLSYKPESSSP